jgi:hypothetical protein
MKIVFFLIAFCLVGIRIYFSWSGRDKEQRGISTSNMVIKGDHFYEEMKYSGKFQLTDDETGFKSISPGGYFKFIKNELSVAAESNLKGEIHYRIYDGKSYSPTDAHGKALIAMTIKEMIYQGFDTESRIERIFQKGGTQALINEVDSMRIDPVKMLYLKRLLRIDSLSSENMSALVKKIGSLSSNQDKGQLLNIVSPAQLKNQQIAEAYFTVLRGMRSDMDEEASLNHILDQDSITEKNIDEIITVVEGLGSDLDKSNLYKKMMKKGLINGVHFDSMLVQISGIRSDMDKINLYQNLMESKVISEGQWISLINNISSISSDMDKSNLLIAISQKMPKTEILKTAYLKTAKTINNDFDYGKTLRAME